MLLVLATVMVFVLIGLASNQVGRRQNVLVAVVAFTLAAFQFMFPRFL